MPHTPRAGERRRVVVVGGGFGGAYAARDLYRGLHRKGWDVTLLDRNNYLTFYPLLVEAGVGNLEPRHVVVPIRQFVPHADFRMAEVLAVDTDSQRVTFQVVGCDDVETLHYDHLVLAPGSVTKLPPIPGLKEFGFELKSLADSVEFRDRGIRLLELANTMTSKAERQALLRIVVVGSNFTGIELAGEYQDFLVDAARSYKNVQSDDIHVVLLEYADRILPALDEDLAEYAREHLTRRGLDIRTKTTLKEIRANEVVLSTGEVMRSQTAVWCAGIAPSPLLENVSGLPLNEKGYVDCEPDLRVKGFENVWAVGDSATILDAKGKPYAATAQNASRQGSHVAANILRSIAEEQPEAFRYEAAGSLAALGCRSAVAKIFGMKLAGFPAWFLYRTVYVLKMPSWARRIRIVLDWTIDLFFKREPVQLGVRHPEHPRGEATGEQPIRVREVVGPGYADLK